MNQLAADGMPGFMQMRHDRLDYCTSARDSVSPDGGKTSIPLKAYAVQRFMAEGGEIGEPLIELPTEEDVALVKDWKRAEIVNEALGLFKSKAAKPREIIIEKIVEAPPSPEGGGEGPVHSPPERDEAEGVPSSSERAEEDDGIPDAFRSLMIEGESAAKFTERMRRRYQALKQYQIDGSKPTMARALPDMTEEEDAELRDLEERNRQYKWLG